MYIGDYRAVAIHHGGVCCRSAAAIDGKRFLANNAPKLPLANCTSPGLCECEYRVLHDRREDFQPKPAARAGFRWLSSRLFTTKNSGEAPS